MGGRAGIAEDSDNNDGTKVFGVGLVHSYEVELDKAEWGSNNWHSVEGNDIVVSSEDIRAQLSTDRQSRESSVMSF